MNTARNGFRPARLGRQSALAVVALLSTLAAAVAVFVRRAGDETGKVEAQASDEAVFEARRLRMVADQIEGRGVTDRAVLAAMRAVPRHRFVPDPVRPLAYEDGPLPIGQGQ